MILRLSSAFFLSASAFSFLSATHYTSRLRFRSTDSCTTAAFASAAEICTGRERESQQLQIRAGRKDACARDGVGKGEEGAGRCLPR
jgi:hypothetical protein